MQKADADFILRIKAEHNLVEAVRVVVEDLRPVGGDEYIGRCPFHGERTSSFRVNPSRYHCFGCHVHGDIISWTIRTQGLTFPQALQALAKNELPPSANNRVVERRQKKVHSVYEAKECEEIIAANAVASTFYLASKKKCDKTAMTYIMQRISLEAQTHFHIGYAPDASDDFLKFMQGKGFSTDVLQAASLIAQSTSGKFYARLRDRIVIPLTNKAGHILGFAGRIIPRAENAGLPKYVNPPNTKSFNRRSYLFGWHTFRPDRDDGFTLVEGYMDVVACWQAGIPATFAIMGTQVTTEQLNILSHYASRCRTLFDGDMPGLVASAKFAPHSATAALSGHSLLLTDGSDPDSIYQQLGRDGLRDAIKNAPRVPFSAFVSGNLRISESMTWDRKPLDDLIAPYVRDNIKRGFAHYNVVDWVIQAYPHYGADIRAALKRMISDPEELPDGTKRVKVEHAKEFIKEWAKPCRDVRRTHGIKK